MKRGIKQIFVLRHKNSKHLKSKKLKIFKHTVNYYTCYKKIYALIKIIVII